MTRIARQPLPEGSRSRRCCANAFNLCDRSLAYEQLKANLPGLLPIYSLFYGESSGAFVNNGFRLGEIQSGVKQGDPLAMLAFCYAIQPLIKDIQSVSEKWTKAFLVQIKLQYPDHEHIVVWDGAGFHPRDSSHEMIPSGIHIVTLPPYSPELNPIEKLWDLIQDHTANKLWPTIERLDQVVGLHLKDWWEDPIRVISLFGNGWIRASANDS